MKQTFFCQYCTRHRPMVLFARKRGRKNQCTECRDLAMANTVNHAENERARMQKKLY
jgi:hypothetical protein